MSPEAVTRRGHPWQWSGLLLALWGLVALGALHGPLSKSLPVGDLSVQLNCQDEGLAAEFSWRTVPHTMQEIDCKIKGTDRMDTWDVSGNVEGKMYSPWIPQGAPLAWRVKISTVKGSYTTPWANIPARSCDIKSEALNENRQHPDAAHGLTSGCSCRDAHAEVEFAWKSPPETEAQSLEVHFIGEEHDVRSYDVTGRRSLLLPRPMTFRPIEWHVKTKLKGKPWVASRWERLPSCMCHAPVSQLSTQLTCEGESLTGDFFWHTVPHQHQWIDFRPADRDTFDIWNVTGNYAGRVRRPQLGQGAPYEWRLRLVTEMGHFRTAWQRIEPSVCMRAFGATGTNPLRMLLLPRSLQASCACRDGQAFVDLSWESPAGTRVQYVDVRRVGTSEPRGHEATGRNRFALPNPAGPGTFLWRVNWQYDAKHWYPSDWARLPPCSCN